MKIGKATTILFFIIPPSIAISAETSAPKNYAICKAGIAAIMDRPLSIIKANNIDSPIIGISYIRKDDGTKWSFKCRVEGTTILWGNSDGRWRTDPLDGVITYKIVKDSIVIKEKFSDGSESTEKYKIRSAEQ